MRLHKTKRLHWFNFGLHRGAFRLHEAGERFTHIGLHVYACGLFRCCVWKPIVHGRLGRTGALYAPRKERCENSIRTALKRGLKGSDKNGLKWRFLMGGYSGGYSNWIFILEKLDIQNSFQAPPVERLPANKKGRISARN